MQMLRSLTMILVAWPSMHLAKDAPFCTNEYEKTAQNCARFQFTVKKADCNPEVKSTREFYDLKGWPPARISPRAKKFAEIITNVFENGNAIFGYAACEKLNDGRGFTCGRIGFTTGTGDALTVLPKVRRGEPKLNPIEYIPALQKIDSLAHCDSKRDSTSEIVDFGPCMDKYVLPGFKFNSVQDLINDEMYFTPAMKFAKRLGIQSNLGKAILYDTIIQHGWQKNEADINLVKIINVAGGNEYLSEKEYLARFLKTRRQLLCCYPDDTWPAAADRVADLQAVLAAGDLDLRRPLFLPNYGVHISGTENTNLPGPQCKSA